MAAPKTPSNHEQEGLRRINSASSDMGRSMAERLSSADTEVIEKLRTENRKLADKLEKAQLDLAVMHSHTSQVSHSAST